MNSVVIGKVEGFFGRSVSKPTLWDLWLGIDSSRDNTDPMHIIRILVTF